MRQSRARLLATGKGGGWFEPPPERTKFHYCQAVCDVPGFPEDLPKKDPFWMDSAVTGNWRYRKRGPSVVSLRPGKAAWKGDKEKGIPGMPPANHFGNKLIPRDEAAKFIPDIHIDGLAEEIAGPLRTMGKHIVPHQFHQFYDESMVAEGSLGSRFGDDKSRERTWKANLSMYINRHPMADEMQRKFLIGDTEAQDKYQDPDDTEYEQEIIAALKRGDIDEACTIYKKLSDPPRNWFIYTLMVREFVSRGLLSDAVAVYDEMEILGVPPDVDFLDAMLDCAVKADHPKRTVWVVGEARKTHPNGVTIPKDGLAKIFTKAIRYLLEVDGQLAVRLYGVMKAEGLVEMEATLEAASALLLTARELGIIPEDDDSTNGHHHRYAYSISPTDGSETGGSTGATVQPLTSSEISRLEELLTKKDVSLPYFKKSQPNHPLQPNVVKEFKYAQVRGTQNPEAAYPSRTEFAFATANTAPEMRYTFRWNGPETRMVAISPLDKKVVTTSPGMWF